MREWLNGSFVDTAFSPEENETIAETYVTADDNPQYDTDTGNETLDKVFLLSVPNAEGLFTKISEREGVPTSYAKSQGVYCTKEMGNGFWWLRSPGSSNKVAVCVQPDGSIMYNGYNVNTDYYGVRPAMWINLDF